MSQKKSGVLERVKLKLLVSKKFYYIRHAQTDANANEIMCGGDWDIPLNQIGIEQVESARPVLEAIKDNISKIFVSPMERTRMTAQILNKNLEIEIEYIEGLREWCVGDWDKKPWSDVPNPFNTVEDPPNGETRIEFENRVINAVNECLEKSGDENILFVSHGAVAHILFSCLGVDTPSIKNATLYSLLPGDKHWQLKVVE